MARAVRAMTPTGTPTAMPMVAPVDRPEPLSFASLAVTSTPLASVATGSGTTLPLIVVNEVRNVDDCAPVLDAPVAVIREFVRLESIWLEKESVAVWKKVPEDSAVAEPDVMVAGSLVAEASVVARSLSEIASDEEIPSDVDNGWSLLVNDCSSLEGPVVRVSEFTLSVLDAASLVLGSVDTGSEEDTVSEMEVEMTSELVTEEMRSELVIEEMISELVIEEIISVIVLEDIISVLVGEEMISELVEELMSELVMEETISEVVDELISELVVEETISELVEEMISELVDELISELVVEEMISELVDELVSELVVDELVSELVVDELVSELVVDELVSELVVDELVDELVVDELVSELVGELIDVELSGLVIGSVGNWGSNTEVFSCGTSVGPATKSDMFHFFFGFNKQSVVKKN